MQNICENIRVYVFAYGACICAPHFADEHDRVLWLLLLDKPSPWAVHDIWQLHTVGAQWVATLPARSLVLHDSQCWSSAK